MYAQPLGRRAVRPSPIFLAVLVVAIVGGVIAWNASTNKIAGLGIFIMVVAGWVVTLCLHEFGHAFAAYRAGDRSVEAAGYLTLNPLRYTNPLFSIVLPVVFIALGGIGLPGGAVYLHPHAFRTRAARSLASAAGPLANVVFAVAILVLARSHNEFDPHVRFWSGLAFLGFLQVSAAVLNLLPIPGLDGYGIIEPYLSPETAHALEPMKRWGLIALFVILFYVPTINAYYYDVINKLYGLSGAPTVLSAIGYDLLKFWHYT